MWPRGIHLDNSQSICRDKTVEGCNGKLMAGGGAASNLETSRNGNVPGDPVQPSGTGNLLACLLRTC